MGKHELIKKVGSMSFAVFISRILGLIRDIMTTAFWGTSYVADAFQVAFQIPNLLRRLFGEGALSAAFIPLYGEIGIKRGRKAQIDFGINVLSILTTFLMILSIIGIVFAPLIIKLLAPGFDAETSLVTLKLIRIMFPYLLLIGLSSTLISILNSHDYFFIPGLSSAFLNIAMILSLGIFVLIKNSATAIEQVVVWSIGVVIGGILQTIINFPILKKLGYKIRLDLNLRGHDISAVWKRFLPGVVGLAIRQVNLAFDLILASLLATGSIAALNYGNRLMQLPLGVFGVAVGVAVLPLFSRLITEGNWEELEDSLNFSMSSLAFIMIPIVAIVAALGKDMIIILFMRGNFDLHSLNMTYQAFLCYSFGLLFYSWNRLIIPIFYAAKDTKTPVKISVFIVVLNISLNILLMQFIGHAGLALATSISAVVHFFILIVFLKKKYNQFKIKNLKQSLIKIITLALIIWLVLTYLTHLFSQESVIYSMMRVFVLGAI
ncbi:MAG: murein biosynthesis integral membrane protein MurJ [Candidatus Cloacimonetes bacterium]|nr:murein biosynthesis integral membrane protein MurJ [Candidatus Cloacimonadota bacterium]